MSEVDLFSMFMAFDKRTDAVAKPRKRIITFPWYGGKFTHLDWLLPLLPTCNHFVDVYGGSGVVTLNREPSPIETYNDLDGEVCNFFRVLRDHRLELIDQVFLTPFSREEFIIACEINPNLPAVERARRFYVRARQVRSGFAQKATPSAWGYSITRSRNGMADRNSSWFGGIDDLEYIADRFLRVQIENQTALSTIERYDSPGTLFYCDPTYVHDSRETTDCYAYEMDDNAHIAFASRVNQCRGKVVVSGYDCDLMNRLFGKWHRIAGPVKKAGTSKGDRQEIVWRNFG